jgi:cobaltochelatase CobS subunit
MRGDDVDTPSLLDRLAVALAAPRPADQRARLRTLAHEVVAALATDDEVAGVFDASPLVGLGPNQVNPRPGTAGLRDMLKLDSMICLVRAAARSSEEGRAELDRIFDAVRAPRMHGVRGAGRTGYVFGRTRGHTDEVVRDIRRELADRLSALPADRRAAASTVARRSGAKPVSPHAAAPKIDIAALSPEALLAAVDRAAIRTGRAQADLFVLLLAARSEAARSRASEAADLAAARDTAPGRLEDVPCGDAAAEAVETALVALVTGRATSTPATAAAPIAPPTGPEAKLIDLALGAAGLPPIEALIGDLNGARARATEAERAVEAVRVRLAEAEAIRLPVPGLPDAKGEIVPRKASEVFALATTLLDFDVPTFHWSTRHPHVPAVDPGYIFRPMELFRVLMALVTNQRAYLHGHTGTGKTTLVEQVCARLQWPFLRLNFDSEITRLDLIGRDTLVQEGGVTVSRFADGIPPQALQGPYVLCFDEIDFVRPDVAYVMQRVLEGDGLVMTEDGGRIVHPHPMARIIATANTVGQGDEHGMYQGARPQSLALLDRFTIWARIDYLDAADRERLISTRVPDLAPELRRRLCQYIDEHIRAFTGAKVLQPISPRGIVALGEALVLWNRHMPSGSRRQAIEQAVAQTVLDRATVQDRAVLKGIADRVFG